MWRPFYSREPKRPCDAEGPGGLAAYTRASHCAPPSRRSLFSCSTVVCIQAFVSEFNFEPCAIKSLVDEIPRFARRWRVLYIGDSTMEEVALLHAYAADSTDTINRTCTTASGSDYRTFDSVHSFMRWSATERCDRRDVQGNFSEFDMPSARLDAIVWHTAALHKAETPFDKIVTDMRRLHGFVQRQGLPHLMLINGAEPNPGLRESQRSSRNRKALALQQRVHEALHGPQHEVAALDVFTPVVKWSENNDTLYRPICWSQHIHLTCLLCLASEPNQSKSWSHIQRDACVTPPAFLSIAAVLAYTNIVGGTSHGGSSEAKYG